MDEEDQITEMLNREDKDLKDLIKENELLDEEYIESIKEISNGLILLGAAGIDERKKRKNPSLSDF